MNEWNSKEILHILLPYLELVEYFLGKKQKISKAGCKHLLTEELIFNCTNIVRSLWEFCLQMSRASQRWCAVEQMSEFVLASLMTFQNTGTTVFLNTFPDLCTSHGGGSQWSHICAYKRATLIWQPADLLPNPPAALHRCSNLAARVCMLPCTTSSPCHRAESRSLVCFPSVDPCMWLTSCSGVLSSKDRTQLDCCPGEWGGGGYTHTRHAAGTFPLWGSLKRRM